MCHRWVAEVGTLKKEKRKDTMMTESYEKWESEIDWSRRTSVVGGPIFYEFIKAQALPTLDEGILALEAAKAACEDKMRLARMAKEENLDAVHDTVHEMAKDEARHGKGFEGLYKRYFK